MKSKSRLEGDHLFDNLTGTMKSQSHMNAHENLKQIVTLLNKTSLAKENFLSEITSVAVFPDSRDCVGHYLPYQIKVLKVLIERLLLKARV